MTQYVDKASRHLLEFVRHKARREFNGLPVTSGYYSMLQNCPFIETVRERLRPCISALRCPSTASYGENHVVNLVGLAIEAYPVLRYIMYISSMSLRAQSTFRKPANPLRPFVYGFR